MVNKYNEDSISVDDVTKAVQSHPMPSGALKISNVGTEISTMQKTVMKSLFVRSIDMNAA